MKRISLKGLMLSLMFAIISGFAIAASAALPFIPVAGVIFGTSFIQMPGGFAMAVQKEIWMDDIVGNLFKANPHLNFAMNADAFVLSGKVVHIQNAGSTPAVKRNRKNFPATVTMRGDADITFSLDEYTSDPIKISNAEQYEESPQKRASVISEQSNALSELVGDYFFYYWAPSLAAQIKRTTGDAVAAHYGTGNRKKMTVADLKAMQKEFNKQNIPATGRVCALDADMYDQLTDSMTATQYKDFSSFMNIETGVVGKLYGFTILDPRATVLRYTNDATPTVLDPETATAAATNGAALFWHQDLVVRALGEKEFFEDLGNPTQYGDIYSALLRAGGRIKRNDGKGVFALVQAAA